MTKEIKAKDVGLWIRKTSRGDDYFTLSIELPDGTKVKTEPLFKNSFKQAGDKKPDYKMAKPKQETQQDNGPAPQFNTSEDIPF